MTTITGSATPAPAMTELLANGNMAGTGILLTWTIPTNDTTFWGSEIWVSLVNNRATANKAETKPIIGNTYTFLGEVNYTYYFWLRSVNTYGVSNGAWFPVSATTGVSAVVSPVPNAALSTDLVKSQTSGSGINICNPEYCTFEAPTLPPIYAAGCTVTRSTSFSKFGNASLKIVSTTSSAFGYFSRGYDNTGVLTTNPLYNIAVTQNAVYILSYYIYNPSSAIIDANKFDIWFGDVGNALGFLVVPNTALPANSWTRVSAQVGVGTVQNLHLGFDVIDSGMTLYIDGIMLELQTGVHRIPSVYHEPPNYLDTYSGELNATKGTSFNNFYSIPSIALITNATLNKTTGRDAITFTDITGTILKSGGSIAASSVNVNAGTTATITANATNILTTGTTAHAFVTGNAVIYKATGTVITGLTNGKVYFVINVTTTTIKLATTRANATAGTAITISTLPTGTHTLTGINYIITATAHPFTQQNAVKYLVGGSPATLLTNLFGNPLYYVIYLETDSFGLATSAANATSVSGNANAGVKMGSPVAGSTHTFNSEAWSASAYSTTSYNALVSGSTYAGARASFTLLNTTSIAMIGLSTVPSTSTSYTDINFAIYINGSSFGVYESGVSKGMFGTCVTGDIFTISYQGTGTAINYYRNGELLLTSTQSAAITVPLYLDSSFKTYGSTFNAVSFGVYSAPTLTKASDVIGRINSGNSTNYVTNSAIITTHLAEGSVSVIDNIFDEATPTFPAFPTAGVGNIGALSTLLTLATSVIDVVTRRTILFSVSFHNYGTPCGNYLVEVVLIVNGIAVTTYDYAPEAPTKMIGGNSTDYFTASFTYDFPANCTGSVQLSGGLINGNDAVTGPPAIAAQYWASPNTPYFQMSSITVITGKR